MLDDPWKRFTGDTTTSGDAGSDMEREATSALETRADFAHAAVVSPTDATVDSTLSDDVARSRPRLFLPRPVQVQQKQQNEPSLDDIETRQSPPPPPPDNDSKCGHSATNYPDSSTTTTEEQQPKEALQQEDAVDSSMPDDDDDAASSTAHAEPQ